MTLNLTVTIPARMNATICTQHTSSSHSMAHSFGVQKHPMNPGLRRNIRAEISIIFADKLPDVSTTVQEFDLLEEDDISLNFRNPNGLSICCGTRIWSTPAWYIARSWPWASLDGTTCPWSNREISSSSAPRITEDNQGHNFYSYLQY